MCILLKSPVRSWTVTCAIRPRTFEGSSATVSPRSCLLNISGARRLYQPFAFHRSLIFRAETRGFFSAMRTARTRRVYITLFGPHIEDAHSSEPNEWRVRLRTPPKLWKQCAGPPTIVPVCVAEEPAQLRLFLREPFQVRDEAETEKGQEVLREKNVPRRNQEERKIHRVTDPPIRPVAKEGAFAGQLAVHVPCSQVRGPREQREAEKEEDHAKQLEDLRCREDDRHGGTVEEDGPPKEAIEGEGYGGDHRDRERDQVEEVDAALADRAAGPRLVAGSR